MTLKRRGFLSFLAAIPFMSGADLLRPGLTEIERRIVLALKPKAHLRPQCWCTSWHLDTRLLRFSFSYFEGVEAVELDPMDVWMAEFGVCLRPVRFPKEHTITVDCYVPPPFTIPGEVGFAYSCEKINRLIGCQVFPPPLPIVAKKSHPTRFWQD